MSEEIDLDANNLSIPEDVFEKFQLSTPFEEDEYITLSDIVPPQPTVPDLSHELNEIPFDNEVVLGSPSPKDIECQVNRQYTGGQFLDISENNVFTESRLDTSQDAYHNNGLSRDFDISDSRPKRQKVMDYYNERPDLSSDGLGAQNYVIEDTSSIIQDSLLSTTVGQSDTLYETPSESVEASDQPRRTKRGRIPNTARYPMTSASNSSNSDSSKVTPGRRRPGRPKKVPPVQTSSEPDSTNIDNNCSLVPENESATDVSGCDELTPNNSVKKDRRSRRVTSLHEDQPAPTPSKRGRKPKPKPLANKEQNNCHINENVLVEFTKDDVWDGSVPSVDVSSATLKSSASKRKKPSPKKGYKSGVPKQLENVVESGKNSDLDDDTDDICLSKLKQDLNPNEAESQSTGDVQGEPKQLADLPFNTECKPNDDVHIDSETKLVDGANSNMTSAVLTDDTQNDVNSVEAGGSSHKRNSKMPVMSDFEYNVDKIVKEASVDGQTTISGENECLLVEDTSKRLRTAKKTFVYDEGSDEDPFANMESSDDEPKRKKKGTKCYSDDEYVPDGSNKKRGKIRSSSSESDINDEEDNEFGKSKNKNLGFSPFKKGRKPLGNKSLVSTIKPKTEDDDIEVCLETTMIKVDESLKPPAEAWATSNEFENFIAQKTQGTNLKIKKVSMKEITDTLAPLDIPVVQQNEPKKTTETSTQTNKASTSSISVQTSAPYDIPMKTNINLTPTQSEKACEFLSSVVKTTVELGQLMSQKSDDFMKKKINAEQVTDTFKMDYCVRKSFLLFKLAKHNLLQMEEDLANQYESFLKEHHLSSCREVPKKITPKPKADSDSDCEIVEVVGSASGSTKKPEKPKFNPKTVFLNKELSIKIAKKPSAPEKPVPGKKKLEMKGRHAVWINKNVMVKKVTPTQSFLAQDSRNKKPPDTYITEKMVSDFFEDYNRRKAIYMCAPFLNTDWTRVQREIACHYFVSELDAANTSRDTNDLNPSPTDDSIETSDENCDIHEINNIKNPKSLFSLCVEAIPICFHAKNNKSQANPKLTCNVTDGTDTKKPLALFRLCVIALRDNHFDLYKKQKSEDCDDINNLLDFPDPNNSESTDDNKFENMNDWSDLGTTEYDIQENSVNDESNVLCETEDSPIQSAVSPLTSICYKNIVKFFTDTNEANKNILSEKNVNNIESIDDYYNTEDDLEKNMLISPSNEDLQGDDNSQQGNQVKSLITLCVELVQVLQRWPRVPPVLSIMSQPSIGGIKSLKSIAFENVKCILYPSCDEAVAESHIESETNIENEPMENFTINCVNTLSEEAFQSLQIPPQIRIRKQSQDSSTFSDGFDNDGCGENDEMDSNPNHEVDDNGWASQLQVQEFRSCFTPHVDTTENMTEKNHDTLEAQEPHVATPQIKSEPIDYFPEDNVVDTSIIKTEPLQTLHALTGMAHIPDGIIAKKEIPEVVNDRGGSPIVQSISGFNMETFEQFVRSNKMIISMDPTNDEIFSQSGLRIRRQHEPDVDQDNDTSMSLLVPHTFEPLQLVEAKNMLLETSSDDDDSNHKKNTGKKKEKKKKKSKKDTKTVINKETPPVAKEKIVPETELDLLTRKMKEKIRQEEKKIESSDSDSQNLYVLGSKKDKNKKDLENKKIQSSGSESDTLYKFSSSKDEKVKNSKKENEKTKEVKSKTSKEKNDMVQCNNVDSTEKSDDSKKSKTKELNNFSGFTAIDQNEMTNYQKLMQFVYDKIIPSEHEDIVNIPENNTAEVSNDTGPVIHPDEPVELLECEPTIPIFDTVEPNKRSTPKKAKNKKNLEVVNEVLKEKQQYIERHGWHCYPIDSKDAKIYSEAQIKLEKLPESFVETYMEYQDVMDKDLDDQEVDRLINLQSLNRSISIKDGKPKSRLNRTNKEVNSGNISRSISPTYSDNFDELAPSDDEGPSVEDETPPPMPVRSSENNLAKNLLMEDNNSDSDGADGKKKIKQELKELEEKVEKPNRPGPKSKTKDKIDSDSLMLTADKMMNKELTLLHAPIVLPDDVTEIPAHKETSPKEEAKCSKRSSKKRSRDRVRNDDDSSSEEEKQWVSTKEKLLKRLGKKEDAVADDAKRAKLVNEFIERRNESDRKNVRQSGQGRKGRARRKMLERQKQLRFLSNELYNDGDGITTGKRGAAAGLFKGRRNIRKVIDKKSLARSTVIANMEEFERKRRLNMRQNKLKLKREVEKVKQVNNFLTNNIQHERTRSFLQAERRRDVLGFEEGVNVLVINDEVCLEYDFEEQRPVVTVHQFFTKVMKAHQYEGVKFMWDACFESLETIERGHGGGGCILAHCMGLGKTLQVLALLHTVLTHPRANMHRVLVCCPLSTVLNWVDEIHKWIGPVTHEIKVFELSKLKKTYERAYQLEDWYSGGGIFIIGYELFRSLTTLDSEIDEIRPTIINKIRTALLDPGPDIIVCDEGHLLKNDCSVLAVAMSRVVTKRRIVLTGTPMQNNLREYFCMVNFIKPNLLGTYSEYSNRFENPIMNGQHRDSVDEDIKLMKARTHILHKVLEGCLQRQEASVLYPYLPKKHEYTVFIPLTQCQWDLYNHYMSNYAKSNKQSVLRDFHTLQKIWSHPQVLHSFQMKARDKKDKIKAEKIEDDLAIADQEADIKPAETEVWWLQYLGEGAMLDSLDSSNKFVAVFRILHECVALGDKVLIFSTSLFCLDALEFFLKKINNWSLGQEYYRLDGSVPAEVRQKWCREFNADNNIKTKLFLISTRAGCLGLNMTAANRVIILDTSWNPAHDIQSIFRVYRFGQKKDCYIYRLVAMGTMEQKIYERSVTKQAVACRVVDEQQIDRHYNLAELTELYSIDEMGLSVAGGVAVGVGDVALLRVARDAAIHAVHEHDSLLRGSGEQGLPEHERAAAWNQFQQEHEHKQMQNDLNANRAVVALKRLEMEHLRQQALYSPTVAPPPPFTVKSEPTPDYPLLVPHDAQQGKYRGRKHKNTNIVQCRIPIATGPQPGPSITTEYDNQQAMVQKITNLLIKHNFMQNQSGPKKISDLVAKVKRMVATGKPITLGPGYDELSSSIANVLLHREVPMPPLTNIERPMVNILKKHGKQKTKVIEEKQKSQVVEEAPVPPVVEDIQETDGRRRRKAAMAAEKQIQAEHNIIDLDNDDNDWQNDDMDNEPAVEPEPQEPVANEKGTKDKEVDLSILLSDDEVTPEPEVIPPAAPVETNDVDSEVVPLHPSLLTNANFIKIVAHTYLAGNPMMDEDAATLAAQYSTLKTLKEAESEGKPIVNGAVYDIAIKVLGKDVLKKLQTVNPKTIESQNSSCATTSKLKSLVTETKPESTPAPVHKKPKIGPKSKVMKEVKQEPDSLPMEPARSTNNTGATTNTIRVSKSVFGPSTSTPHEESILPDEEVIITLPQGNQLDKKPIVLRKVKLERKPAIATRLPAVPIALSRDQPEATICRDQPEATPEATISRDHPEATICLDSDEDDATPTRPQRMIVQLPTMVATPQAAPVPVALTGPRHVTLPFPPPPATPLPHAPHAPPPAFYTLSPCGTRAIPISMAGSSGSLPVPMSLLVPGSQPVPMSLTGPGIYSAAGREPVPISLAGPTSQRMPVPVGISGPAAGPHPVPMSLVDATGRPVAISAATMRSQSGPLTLRITTQPGPSSSNPRPALRPQPTAPSKPGDRLQVARTSLVDILNRNKPNPKSVVHSIPDDPPPAAAAPARSKPSPAVPRRRSSSSSSSSSARSRSSSPDPLSILKDVVHIQAPSKPPSASSSKPIPSKPAPKPAAKLTPPPRKTSSVHGVQASTAHSVKPSPKPPGGRPISSSVDLTQTCVGPSRSNLGAKNRSSVDLTSTPAGARSSSKSTPSSSKDVGFHRLDSTKVSGSFMIETSIPPKGNKPMAKPNGPSKLVGTSKSIILDGKSKSLKVENKGSIIQVTSSKVIQSNSISKQKIPDKRPAPSTSAPASKKKKRDQMTLKDFDIDDIDDIIELD